MKLAALLLLALLGCAPLSTIGTNAGDPSLCSQPNVRAVLVEVILRDDQRHTQWVGNARAGEQVCGTWSLPGDRGRWGYVANGRDTTWGMWFQAWALR